MSIRSLLSCLLLLLLAISIPINARADDNWPQFRGPDASGFSPTAAPTEFDVPTSKNIRWKIAVPGLGHSSPVIWGEHVFLTTAVPVAGGDQQLKAGLYGDIGSVEEDAEYRWLVLCYEKSTGRKSGSAKPTAASRK